MWLKAAGSTTGANVDVWILTMASLRKVEKLSVRKQNLVLEFIAVIAGKTLRAPFDCLQLRILTFKHQIHHIPYLFIYLLIQIVILKMI